MPDRRTPVACAALGVLAGALFVAVDTVRDGHQAWHTSLIALGGGLVAGLVLALGARLARGHRFVVLSVGGVAVGLSVAAAVDLWRRHGAPGRTETVYHGRYVPLTDVTVSRAYSSTLELTRSGPGVAWWPLLAIGAAAGLVAGLLVWAATDGPVTRLRRWTSPSG